MKQKGKPAKKTFLHRLIKDRFLLLMVLPGALYLLINNYLPMFGTVIAFKKIIYAKGSWGSDEATEKVLTAFFNDFKRPFLA